MNLSLLFLITFFVIAVNAIYPPDHWQYSTQLTIENFDDTVKAAVDSGKTMFVRWIASPH